MSVADERLVFLVCLAVDNQVTLKKLRMIEKEKERL